MSLRDHLWEKARGRKASDDLAWVAMHINSALYSGMQQLPAGWNYDLSEMPIKPGEKFLGLWHHANPERVEVQIIWASPESVAGTERLGGLRYLTHAGNDAPHYVRDPHAYALIPLTRKRPE